MSFEDVMMKRLAECGAEACREVERALEAGRSLGDAVLDAIEALPASKTRELRRWVEDWEAWEEWEEFRAQGWRIAKKGRDIFVTAPWTGSEKIGRASYLELRRRREDARTSPGNLRIGDEVLDKEREISLYLKNAMKNDGPSERIVAAVAGVYQAVFQYVTTLSEHDEVCARFKVVQ